MAGFRFLGVHRTWEDWIGMLLGVAIGLSPWFVGYQDDPVVMLNATAVGLVVLTLACFELVTLHRSEEVAGIACGLWLIASPFVFGYADGGALMALHVVLGAAVVLLEALELWQDWRLSARQLASHGQ
jgi:hypothetical protein